MELLRSALFGGAFLLTSLGFLVGCRPSLQSPNARDRISALQQVTDPAVLTQVALADVDRAVRVAAIDRLGDQALLGRVALEEPNGTIAAMALAKITDQSVLAKLALAQPRSRDDSVNLVHDAVLKITDQALWAKLALESRVAEVRGLAMSKLTDQALLAKIAFASKDDVVPILAASKIRDQAVLAKIACDKNSPARAEAVFHLTDQALLKRFALTDENKEIRAKATTNLTDQTVLAKLALEDEDSDVRLGAVNNLTDQATLIKVALEDQVSEVRNVALGALAALGNKSAVAPLSAALPDWDVNDSLGAALKALGWRPQSAQERVYLLICQHDLKALTAQWDETKRVLLADVESGDKRKIENSVYTFVCLGKMAIMPELIRILDESGTKDMAEMFLNSGNADLNRAAAQWAERNGYQTLQTEMGGLSNATWGKWRAK